MVVLFHEIINVKYHYKDQYGTFAHSFVFSIFNDTIKTFVLAAISALEMFCFYWSKGSIAH